MKLASHATLGLMDSPARPQTGKSISAICVMGAVLCLHLDRHADAAALANETKTNILLITADDLGLQYRLEKALLDWRVQTSDPLLDAARVERWRDAAARWNKLPRVQAGPNQAVRIPEGELELVAGPSPAVSVFTNFEGGNIGEVEHVSETHLRCAVPGEHDQDRRNRQPSWFYFRLDGVANRDLIVDLTDLAGEYNYRPHNGAGLRNMRPVYSYDDRTWQHFENAEWQAEASTIRVRLRSTANRVWIARLAPYTNRHLQVLMDDVRKHPDFRETVVGKTVEGRPMLLWTITNARVADSGKKAIWLMARQHSWETGTSWVLEGALRFLLSESSEAARLRDGFMFKVFPLGDPDGVFRGGVRFNSHGYDLNRNWDAVDARLMPEIHAQRQAVFDWVDGGRPLDLFLTLHNTEAADFIEGPPSAAPLGQRLWKRLVDDTSFYSPQGPRIAAGSTTPGMKGRMSVNQALFHEKKIPAFLMEQMVDTSPKLDRPPTVKDRLEFGAGLIRALCGAVEGANELR